MRKKNEVSMNRTNCQRTKPHSGVECKRIKNKKKEPMLFSKVKVTVIFIKCYETLEKQKNTHLKKETNVFQGC
jgi:hypothetical protein